MEVATANDWRKKYKKPKYYLPILLFLGFVIIGNILNYGFISFEGSSLLNLVESIVVLFIVSGSLILIYLWWGFLEPLNKGAEPIKKEQN